MQTASADQTRLMDIMTREHDELKYGVGQARTRVMLRFLMVASLFFAVRE
jgi:hypothetical protein